MIFTSGGDITALFVPIGKTYSWWVENSFFPFIFAIFDLEEGITINSLIFAISPIWLPPIIIEILPFFTAKVLKGICSTFDSLGFEHNYTSIHEGFPNGKPVMKARHDDDLVTINRISETISKRRDIFLLAIHSRLIYNILVRIDKELKELQPNYLGCFKFEGQNYSDFYKIATSIVGLIHTVDLKGNNFIKAEGFSYSFLDEVTLVNLGFKRY